MDISAQQASAATTGLTTNPVNNAEKPADLTERQELERTPDSDDSVEISASATRLASSENNGNGSNIASQEQADQTVRAIRQSAESNPTQLLQTQANVTDKLITSLLG